MSKYTVEILTSEEAIVGSAPLVIHRDTMLQFASDSGLRQDNPCWVVGRVGQESVLMSWEEAEALHRFLGKALRA